METVEISKLFKKPKTDANLLPTSNQSNTWDAILTNPCQQHQSP